MWSLEDSRSNLSPLDVVSWSQMERLSACVILAATVPSGTHAGTLVKPSSVLEKDIYVWSENSFKNQVIIQDPCGLCSGMPPQELMVALKLLVALRDQRQQCNICLPAANSI